jgi:hypothetical protein
MPGLCGRTASAAAFIASSARICRRICCARACWSCTRAMSSAVTPESLMAPASLWGRSSSTHFSLPLEAAHINAVHPSVSHAIGSLTGNSNSTHVGWPKDASMRAVSPSLSLAPASLQGNSKLTNASSPSRHASIKAVRPQQSRVRARAGSFFKIRSSSRRFLRSTAEKMSTSPTSGDSAEAVAYFTIPNVEEVTRKSQAIFSLEPGRSRDNACRAIRARRLSVCPSHPSRSRASRPR